MDPLNGAGTGRRVKHPRRLSVFEELLSRFHPVTLGHEHAWAHAYIVIGDEGDVGNGGPFFHPLLRAARNGQIESLSEFVFCHLSILPKPNLRVP